MRPFLERTDALPKGLGVLSVRVCKVTVELLEVETVESTRLGGLLENCQMPIA